MQVEYVLNGFIAALFGIPMVTVPLFVAQHHINFIVYGQYM